MSRSTLTPSKPSTVANEKPQNRAGTGRTLSGQFAPGASGNAGGRPKGAESVAEVARSYTTEAIEALARIMRDGDSDRARAAAAEALLNRGWGRPSQGIEVTQAAPPPSNPYAELTLEDLKAVARAQLDSERSMRRE